MNNKMKCDLCNTTHSAGVKTEYGFYCSVCYHAMERGGVEIAWRAGFGEAIRLAAKLGDLGLVDEQAAWEETIFAQITGEGHPKNAPHWLTKEEMKGFPSPSVEVVFAHNGQWYYFDVSWSKAHGPYDTKAEASAACDKYAEPFAPL